jgi:hypothetical protein
MNFAWVQNFVFIVLGQIVVKEIKSVAAFKGLRAALESHSKVNSKLVRLQTGKPAHKSKKLQYFQFLFVLKPIMSSLSANNSFALRMSNAQLRGPQYVTNKN